MTSSKGHPDEPTRGRESTQEFDLGERLALRPKEAAAALGVSERTLRRWIRIEGLPYMRVNGAVLLPTSDLREWMAERVVRELTADERVDEILQEFRNGT